MSRSSSLDRVLYTIVLAAATAASGCGNAQSPASRPTMSVEEYAPVSMLRVPGREITRAKYPFIDVHNHQERVDADSVDHIVRDMDRINLAVMVNLSGSTGEALRRNVAVTKGRHPSRFVVFANLDFTGIDRPDWGVRAAAQLEADVRERGAQGLKIFKDLGLDLRDEAGGRIPTNDARFDPVWAKAGELGIPVLIHTAEPPAFFLPIDERNERWLELTQFPSRARPPERYPSFDSLMAEQHAVFRKHRGTTFINAHLGWYGQDLAHLGALLDSLPNMVTELGAVIYEPGRQPKFARAFFMKYQDRILMGKDIWKAEEYYTYFRVLESGDEYFPYYRKRHAFWSLYGLELPDSVLRKVYFENALRVIPGIDRSLFPR